MYRVAYKDTLFEDNNGQAVITFFLNPINQTLNDRLIDYQNNHKTPNLNPIHMI